MADLRRFEQAFNTQVEKLKNHITEDRRRADAWRKVRRVYKKDGGQFVHFGKNFEGIAIWDEPYSLTKERKAVVKYEDARGIIQFDELRLRVFGDVEGIDPARVTKEFGIKPYYDMNPDEFEQAIKGRIANFEKWEANEWRRLETLQAHRDELHDMVEKIGDIIEATKDKENGDYLGCYQLRDIVVECLR